MVRPRGLAMLAHADQPRTPEPLLAHPAEAAPEDGFALDHSRRGLHRDCGFRDLVSLVIEGRGSASRRHHKDLCRPIADVWAVCEAEPWGTGSEPV